MKTIWTVMRKELARVFKNKRLVFGLIFPGLLIFILYSVMGSAMQNMVSSENVAALIASQNMPDEIKEIIKSDDLGLNAVFVELDYNDLDEWKESVLAGETDIILYFPEDFIEKIEAGSNPLPQILYYYNPSNSISQAANDKILLALDIYKNNILNDRYGDFGVFEMNNDIVITDETKFVAVLIASLLPFLIITFLFQGALSIAPEAIAGEKERGTLATLLVTPAKRSNIAFGKIASVSILASISAISSFLGIILSLPKLMGIDGLNVNANIYGFGDYMLVLVVLISTVLLIVGIISIISAFAKSIKEANTLAMPVMILSMLVGISTLITSGAEIYTPLYLIPIFNSVQVLTQIFSFNINIPDLLITVGSNLVITALLTVLLTRMFNSEKIMFSR